MRCSQTAVWQTCMVSPSCVLTWGASLQRWRLMGSGVSLPSGRLIACLLILAICCLMSIYALSRGRSALAGVLTAWMQAGSLNHLVMPIARWLSTNPGRAFGEVWEGCGRVAHESRARGSTREDAPWQRSHPLSQQLPLLNSRDGTYECLLVNLARIFRRWRNRAQFDFRRAFRRGLAHLLILSCAGSGVALPASKEAIRLDAHSAVQWHAACAWISSMCAGKTTVLEMLLRWLRKYLDDHKEEVLLGFFSGAMFPDISPTDLEPHEMLVVRDFLAALRLTAGSPHLVAILR